MRFQNECHKVAIELRVVQFLSEIIPVISNQTRAARSFGFEITHMISDQIALPLTSLFDSQSDRGFTLSYAIHCVTSEFHVKVHAKNRYEAIYAISAFRDSCDIGFFE